MQNTCSKEECPLWKEYGDKCPNYIESWWQAEGKGQPIMVCDCAPKRTFLMIQDLHNRFVGVQRSQEQQRNESNRMKNNMMFVMKAIGDCAASGAPLTIDLDEKKLLEDK